MLLSGGHPSRSRISLAVFTVAAVSTGTLAYAAFGALTETLGIGGLRPLQWTLFLGAAVAAAWYVRPAPSWLRHPRKQLRRTLVEKPLSGAALFGAVLGIGWLTVIATPLVWVGSLASLASGSAMWGGLYGAGFGSGRALQLVEQHLNGTRDPTTTVVRTVMARARLVRFLAAAGSLAISATIAWTWSA